jgi:hypothetical protein
MSRLDVQFRRWIAGVGAILLLAVALVLAFVHLPNSVAGVGDTSESLVRSLVTAFFLAALAYLWFYFWTTDRATHKLLHAARRAPEQLFPHPRDPGSADNVFGRSTLVEEIATGLRPPFDTGPQIVVGETGSGKTSLLLGLAAYLARKRNVLPLILNLREKGEEDETLDFGELAKKRFLELIDPHVKSASEGERLWRWMCKTKRIAILADDLDRFGAPEEGSYKLQVRLALDAARRRELPLVVATRPAGLPPDLPDPIVDLAQSPLRAEDKSVSETVLRQAGKDDEESRGLVIAYLDGGSLLENPFYVELVARLLRANQLPPPPGNGKHAFRIALLEAERERLCGGGKVPPGERNKRDAALAAVERLALAWLPEATERKVDPWLETVQQGERYGLLYLDEKGVPRFKNEVLHAYFASRAIAGEGAWKEAVDKGGDEARTQLALVLAAAALEGADDKLCEEACVGLLERSAPVNADQRLLRAAAAAEIARAGSFAGADGAIATSCVRNRDGTGQPVKRAALEQLELLGGDEAIEALWNFAADDDYDVRWAAVEKLVQRCTGARTGDGQELRAPFGAEAYERIAPEIDEALDKAALSAGREPDDWEPEIVALKPLAWMLPALRTATQGEKIGKKVGRQLERLLELEKTGVTPQKGLEASIAQGFKADALTTRNAPPDEDALRMLERAQFWYSQLNLVHALALRMAAEDGYRRGTLSKIVERLEDEREPLHPLLRFSAKLCVEALDGRLGGDRRQKTEAVVWRDEGAVVADQPRGLRRDAAQLVGEIVVLLNLNETGSPDQRERFGTENRLPHCLQKSRKRRELNDGCDPACSFNLCPYRPAWDRLSAHREISRAFCRDQILHARRWTAFFGWGSRASLHALREFWRSLERHARF